MARTIRSSQSLKNGPETARSISVGRFRPVAVSGRLWAEFHRHIRIATRWNVEVPSDGWVENLYETASYISPPAQRKLWREIQSSKREWIRFTVQAVVMPLIAVLSLAVALIALLTRK